MFVLFSNLFLVVALLYFAKIAVTQPWHFLCFVICWSLAVGYPWFWYYISTTYGSQSETLDKFCHLIVFTTPIIWIITLRPSWQERCTAYLVNLVADKTKCIPPCNSSIDVWYLKSVEKDMPCYAYAALLDSMSKGPIADYNTREYVRDFLKARDLDKDGLKRVAEEKLKKEQAELIKKEQEEKKNALAKERSEMTSEYREYDIEMCNKGNDPRLMTKEELSLSFRRWKKDMYIRRRNSEL